MFLDSLFRDLPKRISEAALDHRGKDEIIVGSTTSKVGFAAWPSLLLPGSFYVTLTNHRLLVFLPTEMGSGPKTLHFTCVREAIRATECHHEHLLMAPDDRARTHTLHLSETFPILLARI